MGTDFVAAAERTRSHARRNADPATRAAPLPAGRGLHVLRTWLVWFLDRHVRSRPSARPPDPVLFPEVRFTAYGEDWSQDRPGS